MKTLFLLLLVYLTSAASAASVLKIEENPVIQSVLSEMEKLGSSPEIYHFSEKYRLDLTLTDLIDQVTLIAEEHEGLNERLKSALSGMDFSSWLKELKKVAQENPKLRVQLDKSLYTQFYSPKGIALPPEYKYIDFDKIKDNGKLNRINKYNQIANDPEAMGILASFEKVPWAPFYTKPFTVAKLKRIQFRKLKKLHHAYYKVLIKRYENYDPTSSYSVRKYGLHASRNEQVERKSMRLFNLIHKLPNKHQVLFSLSLNLPDLPYQEGIYILTPEYIETNFTEIEETLKEITLEQLIHSDDDDYLLSVRNYIKDNITKIEEDLSEYNRQNNHDHKIIWSERNKKPRRIEAMANIDLLLNLYPEAPWVKGEHAILNRKGKEVYFDKRLGHFFKNLGKELIQTETYLSILAGTATLIVTEGNVPVAMSTQKLVKKAIKTKRYDREWEEFLKEAPKDVIDALLMGSGIAPGRFYKIIALGAGQGFLQSLFTGQDLRTGAAVGAGLNIVQFYLIPTDISRPMTKGFDAKSLAANRRLELLEKTVKGSIQGAAVAAIEGDDILKGSIKGSVYGLVSTQLLIWFLGTRYNPFKDFTDADVDEIIRLENEYQNMVGRGGNYAINRQLILDANYRVGGVLPNIISASITLPGNVAMGDQGFGELTTLTHEAHHLMQQHQSGVFGFYLFRYIPTGLITGYNGHPDENFLEDVIGRF